MGNGNMAPSLHAKPFCSAYGKIADTLHTSPTTGNSNHSHQKLATLDPLQFDQPIFWETGQTLRIGFFDGTPFQMAEVEKYANTWCKWANLKFDVVAQAPYDIYISFKAGSSWSLLGTQSLEAARASPPDPSMNLGWVPEKPGVPEKDYRPTILHEFGHALGLTHEHQNYTEAWKWNMQAVYDYFAEEPNKWGPDMVKHNIFRICKGKLLRRQFLDRDSIMLYAFPKRLFTDGEGTPENYELSDMDKAAMLVRYPGRDPQGYTKNIAMMPDQDGGFFLMRSCMGMEEDPVALANSAVVGDWWPLGTSAS